MNRRVATSRTAITAAVLLALAACTEKPQVQGQRKVDHQAFEGPATAYSVPGWKAGDAGSWERQMKARSQGQDEYSRPSAQ